MWITVCKIIQYKHKNCENCFLQIIIFEEKTSKEMNLFIWVLYEVHALYFDLRLLIYFQEGRAHSNKRERAHSNKRGRAHSNKRTTTASFHTKCNPVHVLFKLHLKKENELISRKDGRLRWNVYVVILVERSEMCLRSLKLSAAILLPFTNVWFLWIKIRMLPDSNEHHKNYLGPCSITQLTVMFNIYDLSIKKCNFPNYFLVEKCRHSWQS